MTTVISAMLAAFASLVAAAVAMVSIEIAAALARPRRFGDHAEQLHPRPRVAVLVPAHNESANLLPTLTDIKRQLLPGDRVIVVADNCTDDTAAIAAAAGAEVVERHDTTKIGKGYALDRGIAALAAAPSDIVVMIDADCRLADGTISELARTCAATQRPVQALYLMLAPAPSRGKPVVAESAVTEFAVAEFTWRLKNWVRPLGLRTLDLPCQLMGTGMAFPWNVIRQANLASGALVEDLELGFALAQAGRPPLFCPSARVTSEFPSSASGARTQRLRWEHGHIGLIATVPRSIFRAIRHRNAALLVLALDLSVPPLSLLALLATGLWALTGTAAVWGVATAAFMVSTASLAVLAVTVLLAWLSWGRDLLPPRTLFLLALFAFAKLGLYRQILGRRSKTQWIRTNRGSSH
jgi:cellulose synthase/poly-beta-1,6-N-acetylglucosamine synthase-like glycosyltransferase